MEELSKKELITEIELLKAKLRSEKHHSELLLSDREYKIHKLENEKQIIKELFMRTIERM